MKETSIKEGLVNHPDLYEFIKTIAADDLMIAGGDDEGTPYVIFTDPSSEKIFKFTKTETGYDLTIKDASI